MQGTRTHLNIERRRHSTIAQKLYFFWSKKQNKLLLSALIFLTAWPFLYLLTSFTFYVFLNIIIRLSNLKLPLLKINNYGSRVLLLFGLSVLLSAIFAPQLERGQSILATTFIVLQFGYWVLLACFIIFHAPFFSFYTISKIAFGGLMFYSLNFFFFNNLSDFPPFRFYVNRNSYVFTMICLFPITTYFIFKKAGKVALLIYLAIGLFLMLLTNGRSAGILITLESLLILTIFFPTTFLFLRTILMLSIPFVLFTVSDIELSQSLRNKIGEKVGMLSPRFGDLIKGEGVAGDLSFDESWLTRELMIEKALEINRAYPWLGIGPLNFTQYDAVLENSVNSKYNRLYISYLGLDYYNKKSSHNTYIMILAENGYIGLICYTLISLPLIVHFFKLLFLKTFSITDIPLISFFTISIYFYAISATGTLTYLIIGLAYASYYKRIHA